MMPSSRRLRRMLWLALQMLMVMVCSSMVQTVQDSQDSNSHFHRNPYHIYDYKDHVCKRQCKEGAPPKVCHYYFLLEHFMTMSAACYDCPSNRTQCFLPQCVTADGVSRGILTANRMVPGPSIDVCEGDTVEVVVDNRMELGEGTSIHWHGLRQLGTPFMDGSSMVTQCPINTWSKMTYRFKAEGAGTHFWHSHATIQRSEGLFGGLVVRTPHSLDPHGHLYDHDLTDHYMVLTDWSQTMIGEAYAQSFHAGERAEPGSFLINGHGNSINGPENMPMAIFRVKAGSRYRFRVAYNGVFNCPIWITVDDHTMLMIASDGSNFEPVEVDAFMILSGERYDFVLEAKPEVKENFWIRFKGHGRCSGSETFQTAILRYHGAEDEMPKDNATYENTVEDDSLRVLNGRSEESTATAIKIVDLNSTEPDEDTELLTAKPDKQFYISMAASQLVDDRFALPTPMGVSTEVPPRIRPFNHQFNYISSRLPPSPPLTQFDDNPYDIWCNNDTVRVECSQEMCRCVHLLSFDLGDIVELVLVSFTNTLVHPLHMHGYSYSVVSMHSLGRDTTVEEVKALDARGEIQRKTSRAPKKDTVAAHAQGVTIVRFRADNPGFWFFHCHIEFHAELGMLLILQAGKQHEMPQPPKGFPACRSWELQLEDDEKKSDPSSEDVGMEDPEDDKATVGPSPGEVETSTSTYVLPLTLVSIILSVSLGLTVAYVTIKKRTGYGSIGYQKVFSSEAAHYHSTEDHQQKSSAEIVSL